jgi:GST-like protein
MSDPSEYVPPEVWTWDESKTANKHPVAIHNRPFAGQRHEKELPVGLHPLQLYSVGTPNGVKVALMLEELLALGHAGAEYDAWMIKITEGEQFSSGFVAANPNSKSPALVDRSGQTPVRVFESGSILLYLADKFRVFVPTHPVKRAECISWLFWQVGAAPYFGGGIGHFLNSAPIKIEYAINRYAMEVKRQYDVLNRRLGETRYVAGDEYTIADMAAWPWYGIFEFPGNLGLQRLVKFLQVESYTNVRRWGDEIAARPAAKRAPMVCNYYSGPPSQQLYERHDASDFELRTRDKLEADPALRKPG